MEPCYNTLLVQHLKHWLLPSYICLTALNDRLWYWSTLILEMVDIDNNLYGQWTLKTWLGMDNGHRRCLVNGHWRIYWILMMPIYVYPLLFLIPTLTLTQSSYLNSGSKFQFLTVIAVVQNIGLRYLVYCYYTYYYYTAPRQWVIAIVYCTKQ